ncbi:MAG TPA: RsmE family RNA methyltransferase [Gemmatimonadaceae bacterium]|nr:RsmE family RNA methyltransferase [Gemmatimonadaceae bacterium]
MDRRGRASVATFFVEECPAPGAAVPLSDAAVQHARVRRLAAGDAVRLTDGAGTVAWGALGDVGGRRVEVRVERTEFVPAPPRLVLVVPVADRDRMLWLAEKAAEFAVTEWRPVLFERSRSVSPRGEGEGFARKVRLRMTGALEQSGGAWLPAAHDAVALEDAVAACAAVPSRLVLDPEGPPMPTLAPFGDVAVAVGPEGGVEPAEREFLLAAGWRVASLGATILRFETAGVAAAAIVRATQGR